MKTINVPKESSNISYLSKIVAYDTEGRVVFTMTPLEFCGFKLSLYQRIQIGMYSLCTYFWEIIKKWLRITT